MGILFVILWTGVLLGATLGGYQLSETLSTPGISAPQQAAGAAIALGYAIIPYVLVRAIEGIFARDLDLLKNIHKALRERPKD
jgi:hypothetical protein